MRKTEQSRSPRRTGAWCCRHKPARRQRKQRLRNFAALTGGRSTDSLGVRAILQKKRKTLRKVFSLCYSREKTWTQFAARKAVCVPIFLRRSRISSVKRTGAK